MKTLSLIPLLLITSICFSQTNESLIKFVNPATVSVPNGYSHSAIIDLGNCNMIIISGQVPLDSKGNLVGKGDFEKQVEQVYLNIKNIVTDAGGTMDHIVKTSIFLLDVSQIQKFREIRNKFINTKNPPASTLVQVSKLFRDDILIEIEATAIIPKK